MQVCRPVLLSNSKCKTANRVLHVIKRARCSVPHRAYPARLSLNISLYAGVHVHQQQVDMGVHCPLAPFKVGFDSLISHLRTFCSRFCPTRGKVMPFPELVMLSFMLEKPRATH